MANKRMFKKEIVESDPFVLMPISAQALYFHLCMNADDDGFLNSPVKIQRAVGASEADLQTLIDKRFILSFENGVIVIKHWLMQNSIRKDRYTPTQFQDILARLKIKENMAYTDHGNQNEESGNQNGDFGNHLATKTPNSQPQVRLELGKVRSDKSIDQDRTSIVPVPDTDCPLSDDNGCGTRIVPRKDVKAVLTAWNAIGLTGIKDIKPDTERGRMVKRRILDYGTEAVLTAIQNVGESDFLMGRIGRFQATFDWFIRPNNFQKVLEGNYRNRSSDGGGGTDNIFLKMLEEEYGQT